MANEIVLIESDPTAILADALSFHKEYTGIDLPQVHETTYIYATVAALLGNIKAQMNNTALENYLGWAKTSRLDMKGAMYGTRGARLPANKARTTMRCYISAGVNRDVIIPIGTRFTYKTYIFVSEDRYTVPNGNLYVDVPVIAQDAGDLGTILVGEIKDITDFYDFYDKCENITNVTGGRDIETDEQYRKRLRLLPEGFTSAGSGGAYEYWTLQASSLVSSAVIVSPTPNVIDIYVIDGLTLISGEEKAAILKYISDDDRKVLDDMLTIKDPIVENFNVDIDYYLYTDSQNSTTEVEARLTIAIQDYFLGMQIGKSINTQDIIKICKENTNIKRVVINSPTDFTATETTICIGGSINFRFKGSESR